MLDIFVGCSVHVQALNFHICVQDSHIPAHKCAFTDADTITPPASTPIPLPSSLHQFGQRYSLAASSPRLVLISRPQCRGLPVGGGLQDELWRSSKDRTNITTVLTKRRGLGAVGRLCDALIWLCGTPQWGTQMTVMHWFLLPHVLTLNRLFQHDMHLN